jgi:DNA-binding transcriptional MocR family regulator
MEIAIDRSSQVPLYRQIRESLKAMILSGSLPEGFRLPPERRLARTLKVNRSTVLQAYNELKGDGLVDAHVGRGTTVLRRPAHAPEPPPVQPVPWRQVLREAPPATRDPLLRDLLELSERTDVVSLAVGLPSPELLPLEALAAAQDRLLGDIGPAFVLHSPTEGVTRFRETVAGLLLTRGIRCSPGEVLATSGSQQGLDLLTRALVAPGDAVVVEEPSFFGALQVFRAAQARLVGVPTDRDGMRTDVLEAILARHRPKLIYCLPTFSNPSSSVLALARRRQLLELACRYQVPVIEDDPYGELRYEGEPLPPLAALDPGGCVVYLSSFSKVLFPGFRVGFLAAPRQLLHHLVLVKQSMDLHSSTPGQWLVHAMIDSGAYGVHLATLRPAYRQRRDVMLEALASVAPAGVQWERPQGGFYVWCRLPAGLSPARLMLRAGEQGVAYLPGAACFAGETLDGFLRLNFTYPNEAQIRLGVQRLATAVHLALADRVAVEAAELGTRPIV